MALAVALSAHESAASKVRVRIIVRGITFTFLLATGDEFYAFFRRCSIDSTDHAFNARIAILLSQYDTQLYAMNFKKRRTAASCTGVNK